MTLCQKMSGKAWSFYCDDKCVWLKLVLNSTKPYKKMKSVFSPGRKFYFKSKLGSFEGQNTPKKS